MAGAPLPPPQALRGPCRVCQGARERRESGTRGWPSTRKRVPLARPPPWREQHPTARAQPPWAGVAPGALVPVCGAATRGEGCASGRRGCKLPRGTCPQCLWLKRGSWQVTRTFTEVSPGRACSWRLVCKHVVGPRGSPWPPLRASAVLVTRLSSARRPDVASVRARGTPSRF